MKITELKERLHNITIEEFSQLKQELASDARKGVHTLFRQTERRFALEEQQRIDFKERFTFEEQYHQRGYRRIAGVDEVGRGPLAGRRGSCYLTRRVLSSRTNRFKTNE